MGERHLSEKRGPRSANGSPRDIRPIYGSGLSGGIDWAQTQIGQFLDRHLSELGQGAGIDKIEFNGRDARGRGFSIEVTNHGRPVGHITKRTGTGAFQYFRRPSNEFTATYEDVDLDTLKHRIKGDP